MTGVQTCALPICSNKGLNAVKMMNAAGYDIATLGNHEFDYGYAQLKENLKAVSYTHLSTAYKRPQTMKGGHEWWKYVYDEFYDCVICPEYQILKYEMCIRDRPTS